MRLQGKLKNLTRCFLKKRRNPLKVLAFGLDNRALLEIDGHSKRWNKRMGAYVDRLDVVVEVREKNAVIEDKYIADNVRILPIYVPNPMFYSWIAYKKALNEHKKNPYDLITSEDPFRTGLAAALFKIKTGVAFSLEYHTDTINNKEWLDEKPLIHNVYNRIGKFVVNKADSIRCVNQKNADQLTGLTSAGKNNKLIEIIPVPTAVYNHETNGLKSAAVRKKIAKNEEDVIILSVSRLAPVKKIDELIKAFVQIRTLHKNCYLVIVGDGVEFKRLTGLANDLGAERIIFTGYKSEEEVFNYYGACDIFVNPAHVETYGKVFIEAMSASKPVISTYGVGAVEDKLLLDHENSLLVTPGKLEELKNAIIRLIQDKNLRKKLGDKALETVNQKFNYENSLIKMHEYWEKTIQLCGS